MRINKEKHSKENIFAEKHPHLHQIKRDKMFLIEIKRQKFEIKLFLARE